VGIQCQSKLPLNRGEDSEGNMAADSQNPRNTEVRESDIQLKYKVYLFWIVLCVQVAGAVIMLFTRGPYHFAVGVFGLGVAVVMLGVVTELQKRRIEMQSEVQGLEGDGGRQRT
jgi:hypothetical protein